MLVAAVVGSVLASQGALGQLTTDGTNIWSWSENAGWMNWGDTPGPNEVKLSSTFMQGYVWWENAGWMHLGDGTPTDGVNYANLDGIDYGVNMDAGTGALFGYGWHENLGWVNFDTTPHVGALDGARYDFGTGRLRGYAWGENVGWINLDDATYYVGFTCEGDLDNDGDVDGGDLGLFLALWGPCPAPCAGDFDNDGDVDGGDLGLFLSKWGPCL
jgi:hypothetical protein